MIRLLAKVYTQANYRTGSLFLAHVHPDGSFVSRINRTINKIISACNLYILTMNLLGRGYNLVKSRISSPKRRYMSICYTICSLFQHKNECGNENTKINIHFKAIYISRFIESNIFLISKIIKKQSTFSLSILLNQSL